MDLEDLGHPGEHGEFLFLPHYSQIPKTNGTTPSFFLLSSVPSLKIGLHLPTCRISWQLLAPSLARSAHIPKPSLGDKFGHLVTWSRCSQRRGAEAHGEGDLAQDSSAYIVLMAQAEAAAHQGAR